MSRPGRSARRQSTIITNGDLMIERTMPGPVERVWTYIVDPALRRRWLADGQMDLRPGGAFELIWRNDELSFPDGERPPGQPRERVMSGMVVEVDAPYHLKLTWDGTGEVSIDLRPRGASVHLVLVHRRVADRSILLSASAGWRAHLDILSAGLEGRPPPPFWPTFERLRVEYAARLEA